MALLLPLLCALVIGAAGAVVAIVLVLRAGRPVAGVPDTSAGTVRVRAEVHTGLEQTMLGIVRALSMVGSPADASYGQLWVQQSDERRLVVGSRSEIGRGFQAVIELTARRGRTDAEYAIVRLPADESLHTSVLRFELLLIEALRRLDPNVDVRLLGTALRDLERVRPAGSGA